MRKMLFLAIPLALLMGCSDEQAEKTKEPTDTETVVDVATETKADTDAESNPVTEPTESIDPPESATVDLNSPVTQALYTQKLAAVEADVRTFDQKLKDGTQIEMNQAASSVLMKWDSLLNDIYSVLKEQLSPEELIELKAEQTAWIKERDDAANTAAAEFAGGSLEAYQHAVSLADSTKARTYELVENYLN